MNWRSGNGKLAIIGGIMVNCDGDGTDRFLPLKFEIRTPGKTVDCYEEAFGKMPANKFLERSTSTMVDVRASIESMVSHDVIDEWEASKCNYHL